MEIEKPEIYGLMASVLAEVECIAKTRRNEQQNYKFRGIDEVYDAIHPVFAKHKVFSVPRVLSSESFERETKSGGILRFVEMRVAYDFFAPDGSSVTAEAVGEAMDSGDKASNKAMSAAHKYAILQTFCIPTGDTPDADAITHDDLKPARSCPECGKTASVIKGKEEYGGGWVCYKKKAGCGAKFYDVGDEPPMTAGEIAERDALTEAIKKVARLLNDLGDVPLWGPKRCDKFANENFNSKGGVDRLTNPQLVEMAALLSARVDSLKLAGIERKNLILSIEASANEKERDEYLLEHHNGAAIETLTVDQLKAMDKAVGIPF